MDYDDLIEQTRLRTGVTQRTAAERLVRATLDALGSCLPIADRERWAHRLPAVLRAPFRAAEYRRAHTAAEVLGMVPAAIGVPQPYAREQAEAVVRLLAQPLEADERAVLARHLPDELGALVLEPMPAPAAASGSSETARSAVGPSGSSLASGAPGSSRPIATGNPSTAQSGSVAAWDERRMEHSLGAGGDDDDDQTLARGRPGSKRGLSG